MLTLGSGFLNRVGCSAFSVKLLLIFKQEAVEITSSCGKTEVEVRRGTIDVKSPKTETLTSGKKSKYDGGVNIASAGGVDVRIECEGHRAGIGPFVGPGLIGLLAVIGIGAAVAIGVAAGGGGETVSSPARP